MLKQHYSAINRSQSIADFTPRVERSFAPTPTVAGQEEPNWRWTKRGNNKQRQHCKRSYRMTMDQQATSHQQRPPHQKTHQGREEDMEGDGRGRSPGEGGRGKGNMAEESQDKAKFKESANIAPPNWTALLQQQQTWNKNRLSCIILPMIKYAIYI